MPTPTLEERKERADMIIAALKEKFGGVITTSRSGTYGYNCCVGGALLLAIHPDFCSGFPVPNLMADRINTEFQTSITVDDAYAVMVANDKGLFEDAWNMLRMIIAKCHYETIHLPGINKTFSCLTQPDVVIYV